MNHPEENCIICGTIFVKKHYALQRCPECVSKTLYKCSHGTIFVKNNNCLECAIEKSHQKFNETNSDDWLECPICTFRASELANHAINHHKMTTDEYRILTGLKVLKCKTSCDRIKGENNPGYQHGGKFSAFSENFLHADKVDAEVIKKKAAQSRRDNDGNSTTIEYWLKKTNGNLEEAQKLLSERQSTFSLEKCIDKHGEEKGRKRWVARQEKWHKNYKKSNFSKISQELFWQIAKQLESLEHIYFAELDAKKEQDLSGSNNELRLTLEKVILPDFIDTSKNKIIEFDGIYWHGVVGHGNKSRSEERDKILLNNNYEILHISENDYIKNKEETVKRCLIYLT